MSDWKPIRLGAEGCSETKEQSWIRDPTHDEVEAYFDALVADGRKDPGAGGIDSTGRPYFVMMVDVDNAPAEAVNKVNRYFRVLRLIE